MSRKFYLASMLVPALAVTNAYALGVGGMRLQSALNQPFVGEIELLDVKSDELDTIKAQIAPQAEFNKAGVERYHHLGKLRLSPQLSPRGRPVIRVTSREPIREPYMDFLVEVVWPNGRLVKQFTLLLDPAVTASRSAPPIEQPLASARPTRAPAAVAAVEQPRPARTKKAAAPPVEAAPPVAASSGGFPKRFGPIRPGTGLWRLARARTPAGATVSQTAMALYRNNQDAFIRGDINRLIAGKTLTIPSADELFALGPDAANREFAAALKGDQVRRTPLTDPTAPPQPALAGESRLKIAGTAPASEARAATTGPGPAGMEEELLLVREASESTRQETVEMRGRIRELESQLSEIQRLLQLRNAELARIQGGEQSAPGVLNTGQPARPGGPAAVTADTAVPGSPAGVKAGTSVAGGPAAVTAGTSVPGGPAAVTAGASVAGGPAAVTAGASVAGGSAAVTAGASVAGGSAAVTAGTPIAGGPAAVTEGAAVPGATAASTAPPDLIASLGAVGGLPPDDTAAGGVSGEPLDGSPAALDMLPPGTASGGTAAPGDTISLPMAPMSTPTAASTASTLPSTPAALAPQINQSGMPMPANTASPVAGSERDSAWRALLLPLAGVAAATALGIGVLMWLRSRRRIGRDSSVEFDSREVPENLALASARKSMSPAAGPSSGSDLRESAVPGALDSPSAGFAPFGRVEPETDEADVISEADIYIAYGRYREAEELLRDELKRNPDRLDLQFKLAEAFYGAKNSQALGDLMRQVQAAGGDQVNPERWKRLVDMAAAVQPGGIDDRFAATPVRAVPDAERPESSIERFLGSNARTLGDAYSAPSAPTIDRPGPGVELLRDSVGGNSDDVYSLDISDARKPSADLALRAAPPVADVDPGREVRPAADLLSGWSPSGSDGNAATPAEHPLASTPARLPDSDPLQLEVPPSDENDRLFSGGLSDLELTIEDLRSASELDLRTFDDTASGISQSGTTADQSVPAAGLARPKGETLGLGASKGVGTVLPVLFGIQDDSASSDLLSSQWQMDPGLWDETATKLDLARAYVEMGDQDSAKGILEEVLGEGNEEQRSEAQVLLRRIG